MTLYRTLYAALTCDHCGQARETQIQFRTGRDNLEEYHQGEAIPDDSILNPNMRYSGQADWYCQACTIQRKTAALAAFYEALAGFIQQGRLKVQKGGLFKRAFTPEQMRALGHTRVQQAKATQKAPGPLFTELADFELTWDDNPAFQGGPAYGLFIENVNDQIAASLQAQGWHRPSLLRDDLEVYLDGNSTIQVTQAV